MKRTRVNALLALATVGTLGLAACGSDTTASPAPGATGATGASSAGAATSAAALACSTGTLSGGGSSFQANIETEWVAGVKKACSGLTVDYQSSSSGTGIMSFGAGTVDYAGSDSLMKDTEQAAADTRCGAGNKALHLPVIAGGVTVLYTLKGVDKLQLSAPVIADIFEGKVTTWNDPKIAADNAGVTLPATPITSVHRSDSSGTTDVFSKYMTSQAGAEWTLGTGKDLQWPGGQAFKGSDGTTGYVKDHDGSITYAEQSYSENAGLPEVLVKNASGAYVMPDSAGVSAALNTAKVDTAKGDLRVTVDFGTTDPKAYPIAAVTYVIVCDKGNKNAAPLKTFLTYVTGAGQDAAVDVGYAPLPAAIDTQVKAAVATLA